MIVKEKIMIAKVLILLSLQMALKVHLRDIKF